MERADYVIVGGGIVGVCTAYHLARMGKDVLLLERDVPAPDCPLSSSGEDAKVFRCGYGNDRAMTRLCMASLRQWERFEEESGTELLVPSGMVVFGADKPETLRHWRNKDSASFALDCTEIMKTEGLEHELLSKEDLVDRFPQIALNDRYDHAILDQTAGFIHARKAVRTIARLAVSHGADLRTHTTVTNVVRNNQNVEMLVTSKSDVVPNKAVILSAGYMNATLAPELRCKTRVTRQQVLYLHPDEADLFNSRSFPVVVSVNEWRYVLPIHGGGITKVADDDNQDAGKVVDPTEAADESGFDGGFRDAARSFLRAYVPGLADAREVELKACHYTNTWNEQYLIYRRGNVVVISACSGHGFKNGPMTGLLGAKLASGSARASHHLYSPAFLYENAQAF